MKDLLPSEARALLQPEPGVLFIDVRMEIESPSVGRPPAAVALEEAGFTQVINAPDGFEGQLDEKGRRSSVGGWRFEGLPWGQM